MLSACSETTTPTTEQEPITSGQVEAVVGQMPFSWYLLAESEIRGSIKEAEGTLIQQCMERAGFDYEAPAYQPDRDFLRSRYGLADLAEAADRGYSPIDEDTSEPLEPPLPTDPGLTDAFFATLRGTPEDQSIVEILDPVTGLPIGTQIVFGGCLGEANNTLFGSSNAFVDYYARDLYLQQTLVDVYSRAMTDSRVVAAQGAWSECMASKGYTYSLVYEPFNEPWSLPRPGAAEVATATADVECKQEANFISIAAGVEAELQQQVLDANPDLMLSIRETIEALVRDLANS